MVQLNYQNNWRDYTMADDFFGKSFNSYSQYRLATDSSKKGNSRPPSGCSGCMIIVVIIIAAIVAVSSILYL